MPLPVSSKRSVQPSLTSVPTYAGLMLPTRTTRISTESPNPVRVPAADLPGSEWRSNRWRGRLPRPMNHRYRPLMRTGNLLIALGIGIVVVGVMVKLGWFSWFGHLPGDFRAEGERGGFYFPITS